MQSAAYWPTGTATRCLKNWRVQDIIEFQSIHRRGGLKLHSNAEEGAQTTAFSLPTSIRCLQLFPLPRNRLDGANAYLTFWRGDVYCLLQRIITLMRSCHGRPVLWHSAWIATGQCIFSEYYSSRMPFRFRQHSGSVGKSSHIVQARPSLPHIWLWWLLMRIVEVQYLEIVQDCHAQIA